MNSAMKQRSDNRHLAIGIWYCHNSQRVCYFLMTWKIDLFQRLNVWDSVPHGRGFYQHINVLIAFSSKENQTTSHSTNPLFYINIPPTLHIYSTVSGLHCHPPTPVAPSPPTPTQYPHHRKYRDSRSICRASDPGKCQQSDDSIFARSPACRASANDCIYYMYKFALQGRPLVITQIHISKHTPYNISHPADIQTHIH